MRENERKCKRAGTAERFPPKNFIHQQKGLPVIVLVWGFYSQTPFTNYQKLKIQTPLQGESRKKTKKGNKSQTVKRAAGIVLQGEK